MRKLSGIAPTYTCDGFDGDWRDNFTALVAALGREAVAERFMQQVNTRTAEVKAKVSGLAEAPTVAYGWMIRVASYGPIDACGPRADGRTRSPWWGSCYPRLRTPHSIRGL